MSGLASDGGRFLPGLLGKSLRHLPTFGPNATSRHRRRVLALDGLRGWAALSVLCFHLTWETFGRIQPIYRNAMTASLLDGSLAVAIFFVLSGEALSASYFAGRGLKAVTELAVKRYPRLVVPVLAASALTTLLVGAGLSDNHLAGQIVERSDWLGAFLTTPVGVGRLLRFSLYDVFTKIDPVDSLMPFLWSMRIELIGSVLTFATLLACHGRRIGWIMFAGLFGALLAAYACGIQTCGNLACFLVGVGLAKMRSSGVLERAHASPLVGATTSFAILFLMAVDGFLHSRGLFLARSPAIAMALVPNLSCNGHADRFFSNGVSRFLGRISFPMFLVQFPLLVSFTSAAIVYVGRDGVDRLSPVIAIGSVGLGIALAVLFSPVEDFTKSACNVLAAFLPWNVQQRRL